MNKYKVVVTASFEVDVEAMNVMDAKHIAKNNLKFDINEGNVVLTDQVRFPMMVPEIRIISLDKGNESA